MCVCVRNDLRCEPRKLDIRCVLRIIPKINPNKCDQIKCRQSSMFLNGRRNAAHNNGTLLKVIAQWVGINHHREAPKEGRMTARRGAHDQDENKKSVIDTTGRRRRRRIALLRQCAKHTTRRLRMGRWWNWVGLSDTDTTRPKQGLAKAQPDGGRNK